MIEVQIIKTLAAKFPTLIPHLDGRARWIFCAFLKVPKVPTKIYPESKLLSGADYIYNVEWGYKTVEYFDRELSRMVNNVYDGNLSRQEFIDIMANLISGQLYQAFAQAWADEGNEDEIPDYLNSAYEAMVLNQYDYVDGFAEEVSVAGVDQTPIEPLLARVSQWAGQWETAYREAVLLINTKNGEKLEWVKGQTEKGCGTCDRLNGIVAWASEWAELGVHPRGYPNKKLECEGGGPANNCDCDLVPTDKRRSPGAYGRIEEAIL